MASEEAPGGTAAPDDKELLARHVAGDPEAFGELVRRHRDRLWAVALRTLGDREEAADAVQDALISAYRAAHNFRGQSAVTTWLHRITVNACLDRVRKAASRRATLTDDTERMEQLLEPQESAAAPVERQETHRQIVSALSELPVDQRAALVLVDMQGYPVAEAAEVLDVAVGTVKSRCARGRARLLPLVSHLRKDGSDGGRSGDTGRDSRGESGGSEDEAGTGRNPPPGASVPAPRAAPRKASRKAAQQPPPRKAPHTTQQDTTGSGAGKGGGQA
ncbi:RNA polymerase sigma factor SigM [Streptomyces qinglanensis]|uniref:RNA polymerase sigma-70 factor, ECF subfamily n=1 Tax=Streptomyces qinglanensis TaxID=943816 RepID=A0A1H9PYA6_9ACTN|nr:RNA polymerase sigma factor SigM [Streptomyces qinglanensis]SER53187.1 RNA polymerase sigma-70 factor, ECF subfamily [Streptomyces qinglanensis]